MTHDIRCHSRRFLWAVTCWAILLVGSSNALLAQTGPQSSAPKILLFRILPTMLDGEQWYEFHWEVMNTDRVRLLKNDREMRGRVQLPDGSIGWPLSMSGSLKSKLTKMATYELVAENRTGRSVSRKFTVKVAGAAPPEAPPAPRIASFQVSPARVKPGGSIKFFWVVENAESVRLYDDVGEIETIEGWNFREDGTVSTTINKTTTFRLWAQNRAGRTVKRSFTVQVASQAAGSAKPKQLSGVYTIRQRSNGRYVDAHENTNKDYGLVTRPAQKNDTQRWILKPLGNNVYTIRQRSNGRYVDAHEGANNDYRLVTRPAQNNNTQRWLFKKW
ncbi:MAG: RICIN domain-containing protein [Kiloniellaceae bacterium]